MTAHRKFELSERLREYLLSNAGTAFMDDWQNDFTPRLKRSPSRWATEDRVIPAGTSPLADGVDIPYKHDVMPHCVEQMDAADDPSVRMIVIWEGIREGKTNSVCLNIIGRTVTDCPGNIYSVHPVEDDADRFSAGDIEPLIENSTLKSYFVEKKSRDAGRTIKLKKFKGGWLRLANAGALTVFRGTSVAVLLIHEVDGIVNPDAIFKAFGRTTGFKNAITVMESTGTLSALIDQETGKKTYRSNIERFFDLGDQRKWFCPCRSCGHLQILVYDQIKFPKAKPEKAAYLCEKCDKAHDGGQWRTMAGSGIWYPTAALSPEEVQEIEKTHKKAKPVDPTIRSYWRNGFNSMLPHHTAFVSKLHEFVVQGEAAKSGTKEEQKIWCQEKEAKLWNEAKEGEAPPAWKPIYERREKYGPLIPQAGLYATAFVDCQLNRLEVEHRVWGLREESWGMDHVVIPGGVRDPNTWKKLAVELSRKWTREDKAPMQLSICLIDGGDYAEDVYHFLSMLAARTSDTHPKHLQAVEFFAGVDPATLGQLYGHVRASKGFGRHGHPVVDGQMRTVSKNLQGHHIGTWEAKDRIYERLRMGLPAADTVSMMEGIMHYNERYSEGFIQQLVAEQVEISFEGNTEIRKYTNEKRVRNEGLDLAVGNLAAYRLFPINLDSLVAELNFAAANVNGTHPVEDTVESGRTYVSGGVSKW